MSKMFFSLEALESIATIVPIASDDAKAGVIAGVLLKFNSENWTATATDRYVVAEISAPWHPEHKPELSGETEIIIHGKEIAAMVKLAKAEHRASARHRMRHDALFVLTVDGASAPLHTMFSDQLVYQSGIIDQAFPPVGKLFPDESKVTPTGMVSITPHHLTRIGKIVLPSQTRLKPAERAEQRIIIRFTKRDPHDVQLGPILLTRENYFSGALSSHSRETFRAIVQPNLILA